MKPLQRRTFIQGSIAAASSAAMAQPASTLGEAAAGEPSPTTPSAEWIDVNVHLSRWPFRRLPGDDTAELAGRLRRHGVTAAWCGSFDALLHKDITSVNNRLADECARHGGGMMRPVGSLNPALHDWRHDLRRCIRQHRMHAIRLYPNYHGYTLADAAFAEVLAAATDAGLWVQIAAQMEDQRTQHPLVMAAPVDLKPIASVLESTPTARVMILNTNRAMSMTALQGVPVWLDIAMIEGVGGVANLLEGWPAERVVFGSHAPFFYWESARLKLQESDLTPDQLAAVTHRNAQARAA